LYLQEQLQEIRNSLSGIYPELALTVFFLVLPLLELFLRSSGEKKVRNVLQLTSIAGSVVLLFLVCSQWGEQGFRFNGMLFLDNKAVFYKSLAVIAWLIVLVHVRLLRYDFPAELYIVFTCIVLGIFLLCMSVHLLTVYLSVELISLSSYLLVSFSPKKKAAEGGMKYLLYGTVCSAVMLYGISFIYGLTGTLNLTDPAMLEGLLKVDVTVLYVVSLLFFGGLLFKMSLVPFHLWAPDVYESA
jgi:NADH-quinone oxidoreductase subunit N